jgi:hypothetical protein
MKSLKLFLLILTFFFFNSKIKAQAISYYPFNSQLSIATNPTKVFWMDFRFQMNSYTASLNTEPALMVNLGYTRNANIYAGGGVNFGIVASIVDKQDIIKGYFGSVGMRAYPFEKAPKVSVNFELSPYVNYDGTSGIFRAWLGFGYHFGGKK